MTEKTEERALALEAFEKWMAAPANFSSTAKDGKQTYELCRHAETIRASLTDTPKPAPQPDGELAEAIENLRQFLKNSKVISQIDHYLTADIQTLITAASRANSWNYTANDETFPDEITFENGTVVRIADNKTPGVHHGVFLEVIRK